MKKGIIAFLLFIALYGGVHAYERITFFDAIITVNRDGSLDVTEHITVENKGISIKHGITREFPTDYKNRWGKRSTVSFHVHKVLLDGKPFPYDTQHVSNGIITYMRDKQRYLSLGTHTFTICYRTERQLGFFEQHDELYWNVTGNGWRFSIDKVRARIILPLETPIQGAAGFTGEMFSKERACNQIITDNTVEFTTTRAFAEKGGLTVIVIWPKGIITAPTTTTKLHWFITDNGVLLLAILMFIILSLLFTYSIREQKRKNKPGSIFPQFYPPEGLPPSAVGYLTNRDFKPSHLAADLVHLAVRGFITIEYKKKHLLTSSRYIVTKQAITEYKTAPTDHDQKLLDTLFIHTDTVTITQDDASVIQAALDTIKFQSSLSVDHYISANTGLIFAAALVTMLSTGLMAIYVADTQLFEFFPFMMFILGGYLTYGIYTHTHYTPEGRKLQDAIDGFKMYLKTAEVERMEIIGTPPEKTPQLYEAYLPYAMVLGVEKQWHKKFASLFEHLKNTGNPYVASWGLQNITRISALSSHGRSNPLSSAISSSNTAPGSSSGWGGGGYSGGGGGGGGGGGC